MYNTLVCLGLELNSQSVPSVMFICKYGIFKPSTFLIGTLLETFAASSSNCFPKISFYD